MMKNSVVMPDPLQEKMQEQIKDLVRDKVEEKLGIERTPAQKEAEKRMREWRKKLKVY